MKINGIKFLLALIISALISFSFYSFNHTSNRNLLAFGSLLILTMTLGMIIAVSVKKPRTGMLLKTTAIVFFLLGLICNISFSAFLFTPPSYIIVSGILISVYLLIVYSLQHEKY